MLIEQGSEESGPCSLSAARAFMPRNKSLGRCPLPSQSSTARWHIGSLRWAPRRMPHPRMHMMDGDPYFTA